MSVLGSSAAGAVVTPTHRLKALEATGRQVYGGLEDEVAFAGKQQGSPTLQAAHRDADMGTVAIHPAPTPPAPEVPRSPVGPESIAEPVLVLRQAGATGGMNRSYVPGPRSHKRQRYITVRGKFVLATGFAAVWVAFSVWLALPWLAETATVVGLVPAVVIVTLLAFIPGALVSFLLAASSWIINRD